MSLEAVAIVLNHSKAAAVDKLVLIGIANHQGDGGAWPAVETLARYANVSPRTVQRSISKLVALGEVLVYRQQGGPQHLEHFLRPNRYEVTVACPAYCDRTLNHRLSTPVDNPVDNPLDRVTQVTPGDTGDTGSGDTGDTLTVPITSDSSYVETVTTGRAQPCTVCGQAPGVCEQRQVAYPPEDRHPYQAPS